MEIILRPYIAQVICGPRRHQYDHRPEAIYPAEAIETHRGFIARRRRRR